MNLLSVAEQLAAASSPAVSFDPAACLHSLDQFSGCESCHDVCPAAAIKAGEPPTLDSERCQSCLACLPACPTGAYAAQDAVPALLSCVAQLQAHTVEIICAYHPSGKVGLPESDAAIRVRGCLAGLGTGAYLGLIALGVDRVWARTDACTQCPWRLLQDRIEAQIRQAQDLLAPTNRAEAVVCATLAPDSEWVERPLWSAGNPPVSRRALFRPRSLQDQMKRARELGRASRAAGSQRLSPDRQRLLAALKYLPGDEARETSEPVPDLGFATLSVTADCTACGVCSRSCPTQALRLAESDMQYWLTFDPQLCIGCELCEHVCAPGAITIHHTPSFDEIFGHEEPVVLRYGELVRCARCKAPFARRSGATLCPVCEFRQQNPFGSALPPGLKTRRLDADREAQR